ncbi:MAG: sensor histidine kinase, partial [Clostridia bacterium]|nr:sensor histidine kinase [Clostridia bacterium]
MKELSLNILDIAQNSFTAGASLTEILLTEKENRFIIQVKDDGCGMSEETLLKVSNPFYTTRTTRKVGLGIPLFRLA